MHAVVLIFHQLLLLLPQYQATAMLLVYVLLISVDLDAVVLSVLRLPRVRVPSQLLVAPGREHFEPRSKHVRVHGLRQEAAVANSAVLSSKLLLAELSEVVHHTRGMWVIPGGADPAGRSHFSGRGGRQVSTD